MKVTPYLVASVLHGATSVLGRAACGRSIPAWDDLTSDQRMTAVNAVKIIQKLPPLTPSQLHEIWAEPLVAEGWVYGERYDLETKQHPCLCHFNALPPLEKLKDELWGAIFETFRPYLSIEEGA